MARVTVEDCLKHVDNRFELVLTASERARQLTKGAEQRLEGLSSRTKPTIVALRELAEGAITPDEIKAITETEKMADMFAAVQTGGEFGNTGFES